MTGRMILIAALLLGGCEAITLYMPANSDQPTADLRQAQSAACQDFQNVLQDVATRQAQHKLTTEQMDTVGHQTTLVEQECGDDAPNQLLVNSIKQQTAALQAMTR